ncbi:Hypothetical predicted protein, partial [Mytilus galloprovincialis]
MLLKTGPKCARYKGKLAYVVTAFEYCRSSKQANQEPILTLRDPSSTVTITKLLFGKLAKKMSSSPLLHLKKNVTYQEKRMIITWEHFTLFLDSTKPKHKTTIHYTTIIFYSGRSAYDPSVAKRLEEEKRESKEKDKRIEELEKELYRVEKKLKKETAEREKLNHEHDKMISELKHTRGKNLDKTLKEENDRLKHEIDKITIEKEDLGTEVDRLRTNLSKVAGDKMMDGNPYVTDLSDPNRPQRLAEKFNCLYDNSWTDAFEILLTKNKDEKSICEILLKILE